MISTITDVRAKIKQIIQEGERQKAFFSEYK